MLACVGSQITKRAMRPHTGCHRQAEDVDGREGAARVLAAVLAAGLLRRRLHRCGARARPLITPAAVRVPSPHPWVCGRRQLSHKQRRDSTDPE